MKKVISLLLFLLLAACGPSKEELPGLIKELSHKDGRVRNQAALRIARMGSDGKPAVKPLIRLLKDDSAGIRTSAAYALRNIGTKEAIKALDNYEN